MPKPEYPHDLDLGAPVPSGVLAVILQNNRHTEWFRGLLQMLRNHGAQIERMGRQTVAGDPLEWRAYHAGGADAAEEAMWTLWRLANPHAEALEEADAEVNEGDS